jgi:hypothetical protein
MSNVRVEINIPAKLVDNLSEEFFWEDFSGWPEETDSNVAA